MANKLIDPIEQIDNDIKGCPSEEAECKELPEFQKQISG
jgi:hypothetical protein